MTMKSLTLATMIETHYNHRAHAGDVAIRSIMYFITQSMSRDMAQ